MMPYGNLFLGVYLKFACLKTSKNSTSRIFSRKTLTTFWHFLDALASCQMILRGFLGQKTTKKLLLLRMSIGQILDVMCDTHTHTKKKKKKKKKTFGNQVFRNFCLKNYKNHSFFVFFSA